MICLFALFAFAVLGIFSAKYRPMAKEAFRCTFLKLTFKPCDTQLDQRIKSKLTSKLLPRAPALAKFVYKNFDLLSTAFTLVFFASTAYSAYSLYNLVTLGTCDPNGVCVITDIAGMCILDIEKYIVVAIVAVFVVAVAYLFIQKRKNGE
ncbi:MAG: hypothetical protein NT016_00400 [Candidatus Aenigmarchaeota archaeon]|nr:hypothetical protein [Candidatus Aenigmarchaeota archaeon]